ncbi:MAG: peptidoglycan -binding protein [Pseudomonadota bacterium]
MALRRSRRRISASHDYWPGFVDAMATLLLVVTFLLSIFMLVQYFVTQEASGKDTALEKLNRQISQLTDLLSLEKRKSEDLDDQLASLSASLSQSKNENQKLQGLVGAEDEKSKSANTRIGVLAGELEGQKEISKNALARVELLNQQLLALRRQISALQNALDTTEKRDKESQAQIADLGKRLNVALAKRVQQLQQYRSDFFGRLRNVLGTRENISVVGDRFIFQAEVLFPSGSDNVNDLGKLELDKLAQVLVEIEDDIPTEINWVLRIDGHTDIRPIATGRFPSNWELSSARAISVVKYLIDKGVPPNRLVAAGFGQNQPIASGSSNQALERNRRIELKFTEK